MASIIVIVITVIKEARLNRSLYEISYYRFLCYFGRCCDNATVLLIVSGLELDFAAVRYCSILLYIEVVSLVHISKQVFAVTFARTVILLFL